MSRSKKTGSEFEAIRAALDRSQAVAEFSTTGTVLTANENFLKILGYTSQEVKGKHHRIFCESAFASSSDYRNFWERLGRGEFQAGLFKRLGKDGKEVWLHASYNPLLDSSGKITKIIKIATDI